MPAPAASTVNRIAWRVPGAESGHRIVPEEVPVALSYGGTTHAVMMASPSDLEDFACGFTLTEGIAGGIDEIKGVEVVELEGGIDLQIDLARDASQALARRRRHIAGPVGCGLCGIESIEQVMRAPPTVPTSELILFPEQISRAVKQLAARQPLHVETRAVHAAGFFTGEKGIVLAREDVGRHNALDKLAGAIAREGVNAAAGAIVLTSRVSVEMVQKTAACGSPVIIAVSAPTALAIETAEAAGITLVAIARGGEFEIFTHPYRIAIEGKADVA